jgi:glycosyltransferase involved in cell wall biosynthesis
VSCKHLRILGIRGVPAAHGGFETFAENLASHLIECGWQVTVYCQEEGNGLMFEDEWQSVRRVRIPIPISGAAGTILFDLKSTLHAAGERGLVLTLGYNTGVFCILYRLKGIRNIINMDGIEWRRQKWGKFARAWFWINDWAGCWLGNHLVADNPEIKKHLITRVEADKVTMIPYGADLVEKADIELIARYGLTPGGYAVMIARAEPENSILEVVSAWSQKTRGCKLVVLGKYETQHPYHCEIKAVASDEIIFIGAIYDKVVVKALRFYARLYVHGHQVGGTNPSLVESLGARNAVLAHDNSYNRWVAGDGACYFKDSAGCAILLDMILEDSSKLKSLAIAGHIRHAQAFTWNRILTEYQILLTTWQNE